PGRAVRRVPRRAWRGRRAAARPVRRAAGRRRPGSHRQGRGLMRPVRLELEGFTAFRSRTELDLADVDLFALTGPTGAGKTSLVDLRLYERLGQQARQRAATARDRIGLLDGRLVRLAASTPEALELATARVTTLGALRDQVDELRPQLADLVAAAVDAVAAAD